MRVIIADDRPLWMKEEDKKALCERCFLFKKCSSRFGTDCKLEGGEKMPKIKGRRK